MERTVTARKGNNMPASRFSRRKITTKPKTPKANKTGTPITRSEKDSVVRRKRKSTSGSGWWFSCRCFRHGSFILGIAITVSSTIVGIAHAGKSRCRLRTKNIKPSTKKAKGIGSQIAMSKAT